MDNIAIIGGGFSALIASAKNNFTAQIITPYIIKNINNNYSLNKILSLKSGSSSTFKILNKNIHLHERLIIGGNSKIWGGFIDISNLSSQTITLLENIGIMLKPLSFLNTGSISNKKSIYQLQINGSILDSSKLIRPSIDKMVTSINLDEPKPSILLEDNQTIIFDQLILCVGVVQLIQILISSGLLKKGDTISLDEFKCKFRISFFKKIHEVNSCVIRYNLFRAVNHFLGVQYKSFFSLPFPIFIDQIFFSNKTELTMFYNGSGGFSSSLSSDFGDSIHYCNLRVNSIPINDFLRSFNENVITYGMASVCQEKPGPISNDIINCVLKYDT